MPRFATLAAAMMLGSLAGSAVAQEPGHDPFVFVSDVDENGSRVNSINFAWYLLPMTIRATGTSVAGVPIATINSFREHQMEARPAITVERWCFANVLSERSYTSVSRVVQANIEQSFHDNPDHHFQLRGRFTGQSELLALVGHYEECSGERGSFIALLDTSASPTRIVFVDGLPLVSGFQYMRLVDGAITVSTCFECGDVTGLFYDSRRRRFYWEALGD